MTPSALYPAREIIRQLPRAGFGDARFSHEPRHELFRGTCLLDDALHLVAQIGHRVGKLLRPRRPFAQPERHSRRLALRIVDPHRAGNDLQNFPRRVAELKNIARHAFDREILVDRADKCVPRLDHHAIIAIVGNRAAGSQRHQPRARAGRATRWFTAS